MKCLLNVDTFARKSVDTVVNEGQNIYGAENISLVLVGLMASKPADEKLVVYFLNLIPLLLMSI